MSQNSGAPGQSSKPEESKIDPELAEKQMEAIKTEQELCCPLVSDFLPIGFLKEEYMANENFFKKIVNVEKDYKRFRAIRRDGSCFYRAYLFRIMEDGVLKGKSEALDRFSKKVEESVDFLQKVGFEKIVLEDFHDVFLHWVSFG